MPHDFAGIPGRLNSPARAAAALMPALRFCRVIEAAAS
jgi:hypothetical protein